MATSTNVFETDRLIVRPIQTSDFDELFRMNSNPDVMRFIGDGATRNHEQMLNELDLLTSYYAERPGLGVWAIVVKELDQFIGAGGLTYNHDRAEIEIGFRLLKEHWNKKYATEFSEGLLNHAFATLKVNKVIASAHLKNIASRKVMEKIGMKHVDTGIGFGFPQVYYEVSARNYFPPL